MSAEKLRGGFYTPPRLASHAVERLAALMTGQSGLRILEPSIGDGAFIEALASSSMEISELVGVEILDSEAAKASSRLATSTLAGTVHRRSTLEWSLDEKAPTFDAVVGNLPFVRFQFVSEADRANAARHSTELGVSIAGVSNLWLPMLIASLRLLKSGGAFVLVLPAECLTGVSAGSAREWLLDNVSDFRCDLYPAGSFPGALQEVVLFSGRMAAPSVANPTLTVALHSQLHSDERFSDDEALVSLHTVDNPAASWTRFLLTPSHLSALEEFENLAAVHELGAVAKFDVATVTGANAFFSLTADEVEQFELGQWARPLLPRSRYAPGLVFTNDDFTATMEAGAPTYLFDASLAGADRSTHAGLDAYLTIGESDGLDKRFKCRIRSPWWAVPGIKRGELFLSKRCHRYPRMILNDTDAITTDTIYRGRMLRRDVDARGLVGGFHNSGTLLSAELEGRNFGGGVLELVPSEVSRLRVPVTDKMVSELERLDQISRDTSGAKAAAWDDVLRLETDLLLRKSAIGVTAPMLDKLADARAVLMNRRLDRGTADRSMDP